MFTKMIVDSDAFLDMPLSSQALYFHLGMRADDEGFINNPKKIQRMVGASEDDLRLLIAKRFVIIFESGVLVIKHWFMHNNLRKDRFKNTVYADEKALLTTKENGSYKSIIPNNNQMTTNCQPTVNQLSTICPHSIDKYSIDKYSKEEYIGESQSDIPPPTPKKNRHKYGDYEKVLLDDEQLEKLQSEFPDWKERIQRLDDYIASTGKSYKNHLATIRNWAKRDGEKQAVEAKNKKPSWNDDDYYDYEPGESL